MHVAEQLLCLMNFSFDVHLLSLLNRGFITESPLLLKRLYSTFKSICATDEMVCTSSKTYFSILNSNIYRMIEDSRYEERWVLASSNDEHWWYYCVRVDFMCGCDDILICVCISTQLSCWSWLFESVFFFYSSNFIVPHLCSSNFEVFLSWRSVFYLGMVRARMLLLCFAFNIKCYMGHLRDYNLNLIFRCFFFAKRYFREWQWWWRGSFSITYSRCLCVKYRYDVSVRDF